MSRKWMECGTVRKLAEDKGGGKKKRLLVKANNSKLSTLELGFSIVILSRQMVLRGFTEKKTTEGGKIVQKKGELRGE